MTIFHTSIVSKAIQCKACQQYIRRGDIAIVHFHHQNSFKTHVGCFRQQMEVYINDVLTHAQILVNAKTEVERQQLCDDRKWFTDKGIELFHDRFDIIRNDLPQTTFDQYLEFLYTLPKNYERYVKQYKRSEL